MAGAYLPRPEPTNEMFGIDVSAIQAQVSVWECGVGGWISCECGVGGVDVSAVYAQVSVWELGVGVYVIHAYTHTYTHTHACIHTHVFLEIFGIHVWAIQKQLRIECV